MPLMLLFRTVSALEFISRTFIKKMKQVRSWFSGILPHGSSLPFSFFQFPTIYVLSRVKLKWWKWTWVLANCDCQSNLSRAERRALLSTSSVFINIEGCRRKWLPRRRIYTAQIEGAFLGLSAKQNSSENGTWCNVKLFKTGILASLDKIEMVLWNFQVVWVS